jgi:hypothetical protein
VSFEMASPSKDPWFLPGFDDSEGPVVPFAKTFVRQHRRIPSNPARRNRQFLSEHTATDIDAPHYRRSRSESPVGSRREILEENNFKRVSVASIWRDEGSYWSQPRPWTREMSERYNQYKLADIAQQRAIIAYNKDAKTAQTMSKGEGEGTFGMCWQWHEWLANLAEEWERAATLYVCCSSPFIIPHVEILLAII